MRVETIKTLWSENELKQNTYVIVGETSCVVIDAGCPIERVREVTSKPIEAVFITHGHFDHIEYIEEYDTLGVPIFCSYLTLNFFLDSVMNVSELLASPMTFDVHNLKLIKDNDEIFLWGGKVNCIHTPGHTVDGMCYLFFDDMLFSGDTLFSIAVGRYDLKTSNLEELYESLERLKTIKFNTLYPGHGRESTFEEQQKNISTWLERLNVN